MSKHKHKKNKWGKQNWWEKGTQWYTSPRTRLHIEPKAYEKMSYYIQMAEGEISGFGKIEHIKGIIVDRWRNDEKIILKDVEIFEQRCSGGGTVLTGESISKFITHLIRSKQDPHDWRLWWHSHNDFGVCWSAIDETAIHDLTAEKGAELISICMNKDYDIIARRDINGSKRAEKLDVRVMPRVNIPAYEKCEREFKEKVTHEKYIIPKRYKLDYDYESQYQSIITRPRLLDYKPSYVKPITDRDTILLLYRYDQNTGLFIRNKDNKIFTLEGLKLELSKAIRLVEPAKDIVAGC